MQGALDVLEYLLAQGASADANDPDPTSGLVAYPLHWAAINGRLMFCKVLLDNGATVDSRGGELNATPMMWAAKYPLPVSPGVSGVFVWCIMKSGANGKERTCVYCALVIAVWWRSLVDGCTRVQHLTSRYTFVEYHAYPLSLAPTAHHTRLDGPTRSRSNHVGSVSRRRIERGRPITLGRRRQKTRSSRFNRTTLGCRTRYPSRPLKMRLTCPGNKMCMRRLIEEGADLNALTNEGKSPVKLAEEMKCSLVLERALEDSGRYNADLTPRLKPRFHSDLAKKITFCAPFVFPPTVET